MAASGSFGLSSSSALGEEATRKAKPGPRKRWAEEEVGPWEEEVGSLELGGGQRIRGGVLWKHWDSTRGGLHGPHVRGACHFLLVATVWAQFPAANLPKTILSSCSCVQRQPGGVCSRD